MMNDCGVDGAVFLYFLWFILEKITIGTVCTYVLDIPQAKTIN